MKFISMFGKMLNTSIREFLPYLYGFDYWEAGDNAIDSYCKRNEEFNKYNILKLDLLYSIVNSVGKDEFEKLSNLVERNAYRYWVSQDVFKQIMEDYKDKVHGKGKYYDSKAHRIRCCHTELSDRLDSEWLRINGRSKNKLTGISKYKVIESVSGE